MATLEGLAGKGELIEYDADMEPGEFPMRRVYVTTSFCHWMEKVLPSETVSSQSPLSPFEQIEQRLYDFCLGRPLFYDRDRKVLTPSGHHVWEIKTPDVRLFGWVPARRRFVVVAGAMKRDLIPNSKYKPYVDGVVAFRNALDLDTPKFLTGVLPSDIC